MTPTIACDGSAKTDAPKRVTIDTTSTADQWRWTCPAGHRTWTQTNGGIWCQVCSADHDIDDPHWHSVLDQRTGEEVPWSAVILE